MHFNVLCVSYSGEDDTDLMMDAHTVDESNPYRGGEMDYYDRVPLPLKDGTKEANDECVPVPLDGISPRALDSVLEVITPDGVYHSSAQNGGDADEILDGLRKDYGKGTGTCVALYNAHA